ncbi:MAG: DUF4954 family protein [Phycisphaerae bacterium]|nr:DUF4954 family protein [Phycisphaerae bacterium]
MGMVSVVGSEKFGRGFIPPQYLPPGQDEYYLRNQQVPRPVAWRHLRAEEIEALVKNGNTCDDWNEFWVADPFNPHQIKNSEFVGMVRIARLENVVLEYHELQTPTGITNSLIISCDIGQNSAIHGVEHLAHYIVGDNVILLNIGEMQTTNHAKFGNGIVKDGEDEEVRIWLDLINEVGGRAVMPFDGMIAADAYIWAKYRDDDALIKKLGEITQKQFDSRRGYYGTVGDACVIKNCRIIKDVKIGPACYIKGANKLKNLTIHSSEDEPSQIGEGVELVNGIIGMGCHIFYGCKAVRFVMGSNSNLKYGARLIHSFLGDNSTVSCCELLHNLIFPAHEQHHNNSFLTASLVLGQSNIAAGATIGSNHNSRANDGEIQAGRGFWPGLCVTLKHYCRFASFTLLAKGDYPAELDIPLPFSLVADDVSRDRLRVMPAFWWMYNMYALARNTWKFPARDTRKTKTQPIEFDCLAPDTVEEMFTALGLLELWTGKAALRAKGRSDDSISAEQARALGREVLGKAQDETAGLEVLGENMEDSDRPVVIVKAYRAYQAYRQMLHYYAVKNLLDYMKADSSATRESVAKALGGPRETRWANLGGLLAPEGDVARLLEDIKKGKLVNWPAIHERYAQMWQEYPRAKQAHALATLLDLLGSKRLSPELWDAALDEGLRIQQYVRDQVYVSRKKDYEDPFRQTTFRNAAEMKAVVGTAEDNSFVKQVRKDTEAFAELIESVRKRG